jgi:hypothetical protein
MTTTTITTVRTPVCIGDVVELAELAATADPATKADALSAVREYLARMSADQVSSQWAHIAAAMSTMTDLEVRYLVAHLAENATDPVARLGWANVVADLAA